MSEHEAGQPPVLAVVVGVERSAHVLAAATERARRDDASLVVLHVVPYDVYERRRLSMMALRDLTDDGFTLTYDQATTNAKDVAKLAAQAAVGDSDIQYTAVGRVGDFVTTVLAVARRHDVATVFVSEIYPWWRRVGGHADRTIAKRFDGTVVRVPKSFPKNLRTTRQIPRQ